jgi:hypothetical protein
MQYLEALFKDVSVNSNKTNKIRRKAWEENSWIEAGKHHEMNHYINGSCDDEKVYKSEIEMLEDDWEVYYYVDSKTLFTAVFDRYEYRKEVLRKKTHFRDVRVREGGLVSRKLVFDENVSSKILGHLTFGEYVAFIADIEFKNIEFKFKISMNNYNEDL